MKISIITVNYNNAADLEHTVKSVMSQKYSDLEYIIVDGGSTDESVSVIKKNESVIDKWVSEKDNGIYNAMNKGITMATGDYVLFLNSGDQFFHANILNDLEGHISHSDLIAFDIHTLGQGIDQIKKHPDNLSFSFLFNDTFAHQSVFIKRELFDKVGLYDESLKIVADWKFFIEAVTFHRASYKSVNEILTTYNLDGISATAEGTFTRRRERKAILENEFSIFYNDYINLKMLETNRFKMLVETENSVFGKKIFSFLLRAYLILFSTKKLKNILRR